MIAETHGIWRFRLVDAPAGSNAACWFRWEACDLSGNPVRESSRAFARFSECIEDAVRHGYPKRNSGHLETA